MKILFAVALLAATVAASIEAQFQAWKVSHARKYSGEEDARRLANFRRNYMQVMMLNAASSHIEGGATFKLNKYADWSVAELKRLRGLKGLRPELRNTSKIGSVRAGLKAPDSVDWRTKGVLAPIQDQGQCGSCWAFSATACLEAQAAIKAGGSPKKLSEQFLVDCDHQCGMYREENGCDQGCNGGLMPNAWVYDKAQNGQPSEADYPYTGSDGTCMTGLTPVTNPTGWEFAPQDEDQIAAYVATNGPVAVAVDASNWSFYTGGVMSDNSICPDGDSWDSLDHGVVIVGYGTDSDSSTPFWIIRNSWNTSWGEDGYCRILRGKGYCGVQLFACRALV